MGSPLRRSFVRFFPSFLVPRHLTGAATHVGARVRRFAWVNVYRRLDIIGQRLGLDPDLVREVPTGQWRGHGDYWRDAAVFDKLRPILVDPPQVGARDQLPYGSVWSPGRPRPRPAGLTAAGVVGVGCALLVVVAGGLWVPQEALHRRNEALDADVASVLENGRRYQASVMHWETYALNADLDEDPTASDEFLFQYKSHTGTPREHRVSVVSGLVSPVSERRFAFEPLRRHILTAGQAVSKSGYPPSLSESPRWQARDVEIVVVDAIPDFVVVPAFLPGPTTVNIPLLLVALLPALGMAFLTRALFKVFYGIGEYGTRPN